MLADPGTANAILLLTPEIAESNIIKQVETPLILERAKKRDGFFVVPVAAGGLNYEDSSAVVGDQYTIEDLREWNIYKLNRDPITSFEASEIASRVLRCRIEAIHRAMPDGEPLRVELYTRPSAALKPGTALVLDWTKRFNGLDVVAGAWNDYLLPALKSVADGIQKYAPEREVELGGLASLPSAIAFGCRFMATRNLRIA